MYIVSFISTLLITFITHQFITVNAEYPSNIQPILHRFSRVPFYTTHLMISDNVVNHTDVESSLSSQPPYLHNRGTGAGGANTNASGLVFERNTYLTEKYITIGTKHNCKIIEFDTENAKNKPLVELTKSNFHKFMRTENHSVQQPDGYPICPHGCRQPDEAYFYEPTQQLFIIEKKNQSGSGSVCEKLQTAVFKRDAFQTQFPSCTIHYMFCLSDFFRSKKSTCEYEIDFLRRNNIPIFWGADTTYKNDIINYIQSHCNNTIDESYST